MAAVAEKKDEMSPTRLAARGAFCFFSAYFTSTCITTQIAKQSAVHLPIDRQLLKN
jgi:hypothetical protein